MVPRTLAHDEPPLEGLVALVTGSSGGGIGECTAWLLASLGAAVLIHGRSETRTVAVATKMCSAGYVAKPVVGDLSDQGDLVRVCDEALQWRGAVPILVHNAAGGVAPTAIDLLSLSEWRSDISTILEAAYGLCHRLVPAMRRSRLGRIVFVSSSAARRGTLGRASSYAAAKAGLHGLASQLALELGSEGITVNAVAPSQIDTPRIRAGGRRTDSSLEAFGRSLPVGRVGRADEVARVIALLCDPRIGYLTGTVIDVDGGASLASRLNATLDGLPS